MFDLSPIALRSIADHGFVAIRLLGMLALTPGVNAPSLSLHLRGILIVTLALIVTPNVSIQTQAVLSRDAYAQVSFEQRAAVDANVELDEFDSQLDQSSGGFRRIERNSEERFDTGYWIQQSIEELCLGLLLGAGASLVLQGFRMAGSLIEQQIGLPVATNGGNDIDLEGDGNGGELLQWLGTCLFLCVGGHLIFLSALLDTFNQFPVGYGAIGFSITDVVIGLVHLSVKLAVQIAAPIVVARLLISTLLASAGNSAPSIHSMGLSTIIRVGVGCIFLALCFSSLTSQLIDAMPVLIRNVIQGAEAA